MVQERQKPELASWSVSKIASPSGPEGENRPEKYLLQIFTLFAFVDEFKVAF